MSVYKDKNNGTWYAEFRYYDWNGEHKRHKKRGFATQREAKEYERDFLNKSHTDKHLTFKNLSELYLEDCKARLKATTYSGKKHCLTSTLSRTSARCTLSRSTPRPSGDGRQK